MSEGDGVCVCGGDEESVVTLEEAGFHSRGLSEVTAQSVD